MLSTSIRCVGTHPHPIALASIPAFKNVHMPCIPYLLLLLGPAAGHRPGQSLWCSGWGSSAPLPPQSTFHCARLAAGAALQLVDAVLTGAAHNGLALVR